MTRPSRRSTCAELAAFVALAATCAIARPAGAQGCCGAANLVAPARLALHEDFAVGLQLRARSNAGVFDGRGQHHATSGSEQILEQQLALALRLSQAVQVAAVVPWLQTHRQAGAADEWGGGLGDVALNGRYDLLLPGETLVWPGIAFVAVATLPTGRAPEDATRALATDATGRGTVDVGGGIDVQHVWGAVFTELLVSAVRRFDRRVSGPTGVALEQSFAPRLSALLVAAYVLRDVASVGVFANAMNEGDVTIDGSRVPDSGLRSTTTGLAAMWAVTDSLRLQATLQQDLPWSSWGRNMPVGTGLGLSVVWARL